MGVSSELEKAKTQINLRVLSKYDKDINSIVETTSHVVLYEFDMNKQEWRKRGVEGTLFLVERARNPIYSICILNRNGLENLKVDIIPELQIQESGDYLMYKLNDDKVHGLWVYGNDQRHSLRHQIEQCLDKVINPPIHSPIQAQTTSPFVSAGLSLDEIWCALEDMAPHGQQLLSETEFLARFKILAQSPFFSRAMFIEQLDEFNEKGFLVIRNFFNPVPLKDAAEKILNEMDLSDHPRTKFTTGDQNHINDDYFLDSGSKIRYFFEENATSGMISASPQRCVNKIGHAVHELNPVFKDFSTSDRIKELARDLNFKRAEILQSMLILKQPEIGGAVPGHVDSTFLYTDPPSCIGLWFALEDCTLENGCMFFAPGSHKKFPLFKRFVRADGGTKMVYLTEDRSEPNDNEYVATPVSKGSLVLIDGLVHHKSGNFIRIWKELTVGCNTSKNSRWIYTFHMIDGDLPYPKDNWLLPATEFTALV